MVFKRFWGDDIEVPDYWSGPLKLAKHMIYMYFSNSNVKCDSNGIRLHDASMNVIEKYNCSINKKKIFCFGGSTTFGSFCENNETLPYHLGTLIGNDTVIFNLGQIGADIKGSLYTLLHFLRLGFCPDKIIFLTGINEKQAWFQAKYDYKEYEEVHYEYHNFLRVLEKARKNSSFSNFNSYLKNLFSKEVKNGHLHCDPLCFVSEQSYSYIKTKNIIERLANEWNFETEFFLQPTVFDFIQDEMDKESIARHHYLKSLYRSIISKSNKSVIDISKKIFIEPEMYIDWQHCNSEGNKIIAKKIYEYQIL